METVNRKVSNEKIPDVRHTKERMYRTIELIEASDVP